MLVLGIRYLNEFVAAADPGNDNQVEWPPHPGRVFMALAAAHFTTGGEQDEREALFWLESLREAPTISAPEAYPRAVVPQYVPVIDKAGPAKGLLQSVQLPRQRNPRSFARAWLEYDTAYLMWPEATPTPHVQYALERLCSKVTRVGHSTSMVQMRLADAEEAPEPNWIPDESRAEIRLRLATPGTLAELERRFNAEQIEVFATLKVEASETGNAKQAKAARIRLKDEFDNQAPPRWRPRLAFSAGYARPLEAEEKESSRGSIFNPHMLVLRLEVEDSPYQHLDLLSVLNLISRWRNALLSQCNDQPPEVGSMLSGHTFNGRPLKEPHLAFVPMGFVGHEHADGRLLGIGLAFPVNLSANVRKGILNVVQRTTKLLLGRLGVWRAVTETRESPPWNLRSATWTAFPNGATHWSTVTPLVFDRHPKEKDKAAYLAKVEQMIRKACERVELPSPREVIVTPVSAHLGAPPSHVFPRLRRKDGTERRHTHAILVFREPVCGPVMLGAGRFRGYGLCRALEQ